MLLQCGTKSVTTCIRRGVSLKVNCNKTKNSRLITRPNNVVAAAFGVIPNSSLSSAASEAYRQPQQESIHGSSQIGTQPHNQHEEFSSKSGGNSSDEITTATTSSTMQNDKNQSDSKSPPPSSVEKLLKDMEQAAQYNQGNTKRVLSKRLARRNYYWDFDFCRGTAECYEQYLLSMVNTRNTDSNQFSDAEKEKLLSPQVVDQAFRILLRSRMKPNKLSAKVRQWERALGNLAVTPLTDGLSMRLLEANGKAGNIGRVISLLEYRTSQTYKPTKREYILAVTAVEAAGWYLRQNRNIYLGDIDQPMIDNPTRWLDAILFNMNQRHFQLTTDLAVRMLDTFASRGRSGKAMHYFYSVHRTPVAEQLDDDEDSIEEQSISNDETDLNAETSIDESETRPYRVRIKLKTPPPYYKVPTEVKGKMLAVPSSTERSKGDKRNRNASSRREGVLKIDRESEPDWSPPLTAAFSFADSLTQGVCGHDPIQLDVVCYNVLIKICVYRGALWRAMKILDTVMPSAGINPDNRSYDTLLSGLARVGDVALMRDYYQQMISKGIEPSYYTVKNIVDGLLNMGDVAGAVTVVQDFFNQHSVLPPVETQLKILEFALGRDMPYEAKRHVYFIQQLWKWQPHYRYDSKDFVYYMKTYQQDPRLSKEALQHLFDYFGEHLDEADFF